MTDDGFNIGILYRGKRKPYSAAHVEPEPAENADFLGQEFEI